MPFECRALCAAGLTFILYLLASPHDAAAAPHVRSELPFIPTIISKGEYMASYPADPSIAGESDYHGLQKRAEDFCWAL